MKYFLNDKYYKNLLFNDIAHLKVYNIIEHFNSLKLFS